MSSDEIFNAIVNLDVSAAAKEQGANLVERWLEECAIADSRDTTIAVETGFYVQLDNNTFVVGTQDRLAKNDHLPLFGCEWKSTGKETPARGSFKGWTADLWYQEIARSHQVPTYALGIKRGTFIDPRVNEYVRSVRDQMDEVNILVRAVSKSNPPQIWPDAQGAFVAVNERRMNAVTNAYLVMAAQIRSARQLNIVPWQLPGYICKGKYNGKYPCRFLDRCENSRQPPNDPLPRFNLSPGSRTVLDYLLSNNVLDVHNAPVVISATSYSHWLDCAEKWRQDAMGGEGEGNEAQDIGSVLHHALSVHYGANLNV